MKLNQRKEKESGVFEMLPQAIAALKKNIIDPIIGDHARHSDERSPLRSELFTEEQLEQYATGLAARHQLNSKDQSEQLLKRLASNESILLEVHELLTQAVKKNSRVVPAAEWLLDNFYLIEEQIYIGKKHLPKGYSKGLPQLLKGASAGLPRIYDIAVEIISHSDGHVNLRSLGRFIKGYQKVQYLQLGELWATPIMLRLALLENLRRLSIQISADIQNKTLATYWADLMMDTMENDPKNLVLILADMARSEPPMESAFIAEFTRRLQEKGSALALALNWIEQRLTEEGLSTAILIQQENQKQAADQLSISNSISSLRFLATTNWREFVESNSIVEEVLKTASDGIYDRMDFFTRDQYRHAVERISKHSEYSEQEIAAMAVHLADVGNHHDRLAHSSHVGYYLTGKGMVQLEKEAKMKMNAFETARRFVNGAPLFIYTFSIIILSGVMTWGLTVKAFTEGLRNGWLISFAVLIVLATSQLAMSVVNWVITILARPALLPRMDFSKGIPDESRTMVVIPTLITSGAAIAALAENIEVHFLANRDANLSFALLTDLKDAKTETLEEDDALIELVKEKIVALNKKYDRLTNDIFFLFHRPRKWNKTENVWMGYERKRGKLGELNALIQGRGHENFSVIIGEAEVYSKVKYIITLDSDTQLPRETAWKMVGTMMHPLNQPIFNEKLQRVTDGYTILQPRVSNSLPGSGSSVYARIHGNEPGTDPYTRATSDVYQDLFNEGSFIGKGIYEIASFEKTFDNKFPENRILSHDLLEGSYARSALMTDVQLYEDYPGSYLVDLQRRRRWIRGDWQIASWATPFVPDQNRQLRRNTLSGLSRWKIFDNLRRSVVPLSLLVLLIAGWTILENPASWTLVVMGITLIPSIISFVWEIIRKPEDVTFFQHLIFANRSLKDNLKQQVLGLMTLPFEAFVFSRAILVTLWRIYISRRRLLQWNPYGSTNSKKTIIGTYSVMWFAPFFAVTMFVFLSVWFPVSLITAFPFLVGWLLAPSISWYISLPGSEKKTEISATDALYLRRLARKIWSFFEVFVGKEDNWLPPDNYQEHPVERVAHRTSPTNIGLSMLANLTAWDFGYIGHEALLERTASTIQTLQRLEKYRGHLFNWYDTISLSPLAPRYISTVDSGNFIGHVITLKQGLMAVPDRKIISQNDFNGLIDTLGVLIEKTNDNRRLRKFSDNIILSVGKYIHTLKPLRNYLAGLQRELKEIITELDPDPDTEQDWWAEKAMEHLEDLLHRLQQFFPWLALPEAAPEFEELLNEMPSIPSINQLARIEQSMLHKIVALYLPENTANENEWLNQLRAAVTDSARLAKQIQLRADRIMRQCDEFTNVEYDFLYDSTQHLLIIGYNADEHRSDNSFYDLLASEARLTTFVAVAQGKLPQQSWFALGRQLTNHGTDPILLSWSGSMFEYLMPLLVMPTYENTLLDESNKSVIKKQIEYGRSSNVPWGISESGYSNVDAHLNYQYRAFGVPGLGFKRGLGSDLVIAPYATVMALMVAPGDAYANLQEMKGLGFEGRYGFYEAVDYTAARLPRRTTNAIIRSFMAHHQGMSFLSISYLLLDQPMQRRFESDVQVKSALLLLQERIPRITTFYSPTVHESDISVMPGGNESMRVINTPHTAIPEVQLLSNGRFHSMLTNSGGGYSRWKNILLTRWREDATCDNWGTFCYIRDLDSNNFWSAAYQPTLNEGNNYEAVFSQGRAEFRRKDNNIETHTEVVVSPEDDVELRRIHINNRSRKRRFIEITSYAEVVLASAAGDEAHPAFSNLFVQTEINEQRHAILCTRRPRSGDEVNPYLFHLMKAHGAEIQQVTYETDRAEFIGRGNSIHNPGILYRNKGLSGASGSVLDPVIAIQYRIYIEPYKSVIVDIITGAADTKDICNALIEKYQDKHIANRGLELAWTHSQVILRQINATEADAQLYNRLAGSIIFANSSLRTDPATIMKNHRGQSALWAYAISGDLPIVLLQIEDSSSLDLVKQMVQAHAYWRLKGLIVDLIIWNDDHGGYRQELNDRIHALVVPGSSANLKDQPGGIFIRSTDQISNEDRILFQTVAHIVISDKLGTLEEQINRGGKPKSLIPVFSPSKFHTSVDSSLINDLPLPENLQFFNGFGGFSPDGKEYVIKTVPGKPTPAPWINVMGNPQFGTVVTETGSSYTWVENAHEIRLTPWNNDPITDLKGEAFYLRDEESGRFWSPSALPARGNSPYITRHGFGYSIFEHSEDGIFSSMKVYVAIDAPIKFVVLTIRNNSSRPRRISATGYVEWVLADLRSKSQMHTITEMHTRTGALLAYNAYSTEFEHRVAFFDVDDTSRSFTSDRSEFIGRNGTLAYPEAMNKVRLSGKTGAGLDPCAALQVAFDLDEEEEKTVTFRLGAGRSMDDALGLIERFEGNNAAVETLKKADAFWKETLTNVQVYTPDAATNILTNGWLNYQALSCRIWARSGFYQSGGAFGFRDQLQDVLSLMHTKPELVREQILLCASRQFIEGDVQHWWHPPKGRGVRTTCSDDYLWLPFVTAKYVEATGDRAILDEQINFIEGRLLNAGEESYYDLPIRSDKASGLYDHCVRAIEHGLRFGEHGLPFMGSGDWNDGMDRVGQHGKGESVWLAFFLYDILQRFSPIAQSRNETAFAGKCREAAETLKVNINKNAWDGDWYRRAYFDDGTPLGSRENEECKIDSIAQSWSVLSGAGEKQRSLTALGSADKYLVRKEDGMIQLFDPPFDKSPMNPGYIKGYVPGVRENGGQYTHAAIWLVMAFAETGNAERTWELLKMINPLNRGIDPEKIAVYKSEPYVIAADVYAEPKHKGRGGWTWYTGSAGWMYQLILESFVGLKRKGDVLEFKTCLPKEWKEVKVQYKYASTMYFITIQSSFTTDVRTVQLEDVGGVKEVTI